jgi:hypothetical protein
MIRAEALAERLVQRLRARAARLAANRADTLRRDRRADWRSATALWPDFTTDRHGR